MSDLFLYMKYTLLLLVLFWVFACYGQAVDSLQIKTLTVSEMKEDLDLYKKLLQETHPGLFRYQSEEEFNQSIAALEEAIKEPLPFYDFYRQLARLTASIRCAHTQLFPTENIMQSLNNSYSVFPFFLYPVEDRLYVLFSGLSDDSVRPGDEIISINGKSVDQIRTRIAQYYFRDGNNDAVLKQFLQGGLFSMYYYLGVEQPTEFDLVLQDVDGTEKKLQVGSMTYSQAEKNYVKNPVNSRMMSFYNKNNKNWDLQILDEVPATAYLSLQSFGAKGINSQDEAVEAFRKFMDKVMKKLEKNDIRHLIVELRGNKGGWDIQGRELFSYLMKSDSAVGYYAAQSTVTRDSEYLRYADFSADDLEKAKNNLTAQEDGTFRMDPAGNEALHPVVPKKNRFTGKVYILTNAQCASACAEFTAVAKANQAAILIGDETGGAWEGGNGGSFINYVLPNSGISSNSPLVKYQMAVPRAEVPGRGTIPDHPVTMTIEDILSGRDAQKEFVFQLIRNGDKDTK